MPALFAFAVTLVSTVAHAKLSGDATPLSSSDIEGYIPYAELARAAYCLGNSDTWDHGDACAANDDFELYGSGGDGTADSPYYFVGYSPSLTSIVVAHGGIEAEELFEGLQNTDSASQAPVNASLFPGAGEDVRAHAGFLSAHAKTADAVLAAVQDTISGTGAAVLTTVGHGLGGALAELDAVYLRLNVPFIRMNTITFGKPRVGNEAWGDLVDANADSYARINNKKDPIPVLPLRTAEYEHPTGEIHVVDEGIWMICAAGSTREDEEDAECTIQAVPDASEGELEDHAGPYGGVFIGGGYC